MQNHLKERQAHLEQLKKQHERDSLLKERDVKDLSKAEEYLRAQQTHKSQVSHQVRDLNRSIRQERARLRMIQSTLRDNHTAILQDE